MRLFLLGLLLAGASSVAPAWAQTRLRTVEGQGGVPLLVAEAGDPAKPGILFLHGFGQSYLSFHRQFEALQGRYHLVAFDLRGHGGSGKPSDPAAYRDSKVWADDVAAVIEATGLARPVLVGWSFGGYVAVDYVHHHGTDHLAGLELVGSLGGLDGGPPQGQPKPASAPPQAAETPVQADSRLLRSLDLAGFVEAAQRRARGYVNAATTDEERRTLFATELMLPAYVRRAMEGGSLDNRAALPRVTLPVLLTRGSADQTMGEVATGTIRAALPDATLSLYPDTGHLTFVERQERFDRELDAFATKVGAR